MARSIPIVVVGYNRPDSLRRLLGSLLKGVYPGRVDLIISIDGQKGDGKDQIQVEAARKVAADFNWSYGEKRLILHEANMGLRKHVLSCGDLSAEFDGVIVLEDDLYVAPGFYTYVLRADEFYHDEPGVAGISLYSHSYNETAQFPFRPLADQSDVFFLQYAPSLGQFWSREKWKGFREWYDSLAGGQVPVGLPPNIDMWPETSWKKYFIGYLIRHNLFFVYPRYSLTTLFSDTGTNLRVRENIFQVPLWMGKQAFTFEKLERSGAVYDVYCEILPDCLKQWNPALKAFDFETDLYGMKSAQGTQGEWMLSSRNCSRPVMNFGREMKPHDMNIVEGIAGNYFSLGKKKDFDEPNYFLRLLKCHEKKELAYWYPIREYHFYKNRLMTTDNASHFYFDPVFSFRKIMTMLRYAWKYFRKKQG